MKRVVTIGGGTGSFVLLSGLKKYPLEISAIVSMADDGGSTGLLRDELGVLPPGDVRKCLAALAQASPEVRDLFNYRFTNGKLEGHNAGNLFISALEKVTGSFTKAVEVAGKILNIYGKVIPVTEEDMRLVVELNNGVSLQGESKLDDNKEVRENGVRGVSLNHEVEANEDALTAISEADLIVIGPGDIYGSIVPNLLVNGISESLKKTKAKIIVVANITNKKGLTDGFTVQDFAKFIEGYMLGRTVDMVIYNTQVPEEDLVLKYEEQEGQDMIVEYDTKSEIPVMGVDLLVDEEKHFIRHDSDKLATAVVEYMKDNE
ncbi:hypothetical protein COB52_00745 [Candidatus Kaiserbacteria bacterium]|nr:MAG: hypothetical protein COB52_00745 [Candidatus Kaiserbacteria bacterium]